MRMRLNPFLMAIVLPGALLAGTGCVETFISRYTDHQTNTMAWRFIHIQHGHLSTKVAVQGGAKEYTIILCILPGRIFRRDGERARPRRSCPSRAEHREDSC